MTEIRILVIDDDEDGVAPLITEIVKQGYVCRLEDFAKAGREISDFDPDVVVLDLLGPDRVDKPGLLTFDFIWNSHFCPLIIYSAAPDLANADHPFVEKVAKGMGSPARVMLALDKLQPHIDAIRAAKQSIRQAFALALRYVAQDAFSVYSDEDAQKRTDLIVRAGKRRVAALMDENMGGETKMQSWEQYICPPVTPQIRLGDILRVRGEETNDPSSFRVVLTPCCDLESGENRKPKVEQVLTARCQSIEKAVKSVGLGDLNSNDKKERLVTQLLSQGHRNGILPLPGLSARIPHLTADLRDLEMIPFDEIQEKNGKFERIASVDSPFRELIAWAYMQVGCRPGLPERDTSAWCEEICTCLNVKKD